LVAEKTVRIDRAEEILRKRNGGRSLILSLCQAICCFGDDMDNQTGPEFIWENAQYPPAPWGSSVTGPMFRATACRPKKWPASGPVGKAALPIKEKAVPGLDEDVVTMSIEAARNAR
jgi:hypothetical protein